MTTVQNSEMQVAIYIEPEPQSLSEKTNCTYNNIVDNACIVFYLGGFAVSEISTVIASMTVNLMGDTESEIHQTAKSVAIVSFSILCLGAFVRFPVLRGYMSQREQDLYGRVGFPVMMAGLCAAIVGLIGTLTPWYKVFSGIALSGAGTMVISSPYGHLNPISNRSPNDAVQTTRP